MGTNLDLIDAQAMRLEHPENFHAPNKEQLDAIRIGDFVKIDAKDERFWVKVVDIEGIELVGKVSNELKGPLRRELSFGDRICFEKRHIFDIY